MSRGMNAAHNFTQALRSKRRYTQPASLQRLAATSQQSAGETASADPKVVQPLEIEVVHEPSSPVEQHLEEDVVRRLLEEFEDEEWQQLAKVCTKPKIERLLDGLYCIASYLTGHTTHYTSLA